MSNRELPTIFLIGPMGAGKTTIGRLLARLLDREFVDVDYYIEEKTGADIPWIFAKEGESGFRERETKAVEELSQLKNLVIATGGGVVMREENRDYLKKSGLVIYLNADVRIQLQRTRKDTKRPLLQTQNPEMILRELYRIRNPLYQDIADIEIISGRLYPKKMVMEIISRIESLGYNINSADE